MADIPNLLSQGSSFRGPQIAIESQQQMRENQARNMLNQQNITSNQQLIDATEQAEIDKLGQQERQVLADKMDQVAAVAMRAQNAPQLAQVLQGFGLQPDQDLLDPNTPFEISKEKVLSKSKAYRDAALKYIGKSETPSQFGAQQTFKDEKGALFFGTTKRNPTTGEVESILVPVSGGNEKPVGQVQLTSPMGLTAEERVTQKGAEAGAAEAAKEAAKLKIQYKLKPQVESAVAQAVGLANQNAKQAGVERSNKIALNTYETAMKGLIQGLGGAETGPIVGRLPAFTSNQQIADGAVAAMAPILKSMFRTAGEGTFTDKDQELLLNMVPTRKDTPAARISKLANIDAIVNAKLGQSQSLSAANKQGWKLMQDAQGNKAYVGPNGEIEEVQ